MARSLNGESTSSEQVELNNLLTQNEHLQQQYDLLARIWKEKSGDTKDEDNVNASDTISKIISRAAIEGKNAEIVFRRKRRRRRINISIAIASLVCVIVAVWYLKNDQQSYVNEDKPGNKAFITQNGSRTRSLLADGTTVWLNAGSKLYYENDFNGPTREVRLEGEAFFDVVEQTNRLFIVHTSGIDIRVLGTAFNVKSYPEDQNVETTLYRGQVQVLRQKDFISNAIQLEPNQKLILSKQAAKEYVKLSDEKTPPTKRLPANFIITLIDSTKKESERIETAWVYSRLEFRGDSFEVVAKKLERWYNVNIVFTDEKVKLLSVTGSFEKETVEQAFEALKEAFAINYKINNHEISVSSSQ